MLTELQGLVRYKILLSDYIGTSLPLCPIASVKFILSCHQLFFSRRLVALNSLNTILLGLCFFVSVRLFV